MTLQPLVTRFFSDFLPQTYGYSENPLQIEYAHSVVEWLNGSGLALIEADTGTGKTLGYLAPIMLATSLNPKLRICISTETISLQRQILNEAQKVALFLKSESIEPIFPAAYRGIQNYLDPIALDYIIDEWLADGTIDNEISVALEKAARSEIVSGEGFLSNFLEACAEILPPSFNPNLLALSQENSDANPAYSTMREDVESATLEICSHVRTASSLKFSGNQSYDFVLFDEADALPRISEAISRVRISTGMLLRGKNALSDISATKGGKKVTEAINYLVDALKAGVDDGSRTKHAYYHDIFRDCVVDLDKAYSTLITSDPHTFSTLSVKRQYELTTLLQHCRNAPNSSFTKAFFGSSSRAGEFIEIGDLFATSFIKQRHVKDKMSFCFTSATLSDATKNLSFNSIKYDLMIQHLGVEIERKYEPSFFGEMSFRTSHIDDSLYPFIQSSVENDEAVFDNKWLDTLASLIKQLKDNQAERTLVLFPAYRDIDALMEHSPSLADFVAVHKRGVRGRAAADLLMKHGVLLSASLWTGFSERMDDGSQLFANLVISRLPHPPSDKFAINMLSDYYKESGTPFAEDKAKKSARLNAHVASLRKFKQAIGRPIRNIDDIATVYICDSRASAGSKRGAQLALAIPKRFRENYANALNLFDDRTLNATETTTKKGEIQWLF